MHKYLPRISATRIVIIVAAIIVVYFVVGGALKAVRSNQLSRQEETLRADIKDLESRHDRLLALRDYLNSDEYIEFVAREELGLVRKGEIGIVAIPSQPSPTPAPGEEPPTLWWDVLIR